MDELEKYQQYKQTGYVDAYYEGQLEKGTEKHHGVGQSSEWWIGHGDGKLHMRAYNGDFVNGKRNGLGRTFYEDFLLKFQHDNNILHLCRSLLE